MSDHAAISPEEEPHLDALRRAVAQGFTPVPLANVPVLFYERPRGCVVETIKIESMTKATAAHWRPGDDSPWDNAQGPIWQTDGDVATVINELLTLPHPDPDHIFPR
ncbi:MULTISPECIES: hypothetical protein [unclassified Amycolatopsis]|uniref:hypothetical protein n=1 Tax=unclassified Amycolatopsis TaxID=2618356 RepID=UPI001C6A233A|nr:hypothetical protein [Amycolatopsis sp. DSM 110486]QYN20171.1 hypothetical protein K1T34_47810 [Amycolatopsis sp. DSM 110486]